VISSKDILSGDRRALAKAITLVESSKQEHREQAHKLLEEILPYTGKSYRIGITGTPGVGKSTFIETFGEHLISLGKKVAVLAVDPTSPMSGGSILGDKTRMENLSHNENAFIRPSPSSGHLGGVAFHTHETILLCEAAGFDTILVETVGVGQSEFQVSQMVDFFMVLLLPNAGDELQGIKKGILELADGIIINKADGKTKDLANVAKSQYESAISLFHIRSFWTPEVLTCSATKNEGIKEIHELLKLYKSNSEKEKFWDQKRKDQLKKWFKSSLEFELSSRIQSNSVYKEKFSIFEKEILDMKKTPGSAADSIASLIFKG
jgi:LAO/AO transport system kinase